MDSCNLASAGLHLLKDGRVQGVVSSNATTISCSTVFVQDPIRGIAVSMDFSVPVTRFSYGRQVVFFKSWGLDDLEAAEEVREPKYKAETPSMLQDLEVDPPEGYNLLELSELSNFKLLCNPTCPWLTITSEGELSVNSTETKKPFPEDMRSQAGRNSFLNVGFSRKRSQRVLSRNVLINRYLGLSGHPASSFTRSQVYNHKNEHRTVTMMVWKIIFLFQLCISRFQPLIFGGVSPSMISDVSDLWWFSDITPRCRSSPGCLLAAVRFQQQLGTFLHIRILPHWARRSRKLWLCKQGFGKEVRGR